MNRKNTHTQIRNYDQQQHKFDTETFTIELAMKMAYSKGKRPMNTLLVPRQN